jgi:hypothetical protein
MYAEVLVGYGYDTASVLYTATAEDLEEAFVALKVKKPHRRLILNHLTLVGQCLSGGGSEGSTQQYGSSSGQKNEDPQAPAHTSNLGTLNVDQHDHALPCIGIDAPEQHNVDIGRKYAAGGIAEAEEEQVQMWYQQYVAEHSADDKLLKAMSQLKFKRVLKMCRRGEISADAKVYSVPLLNWLGQYQRHHFGNTEGNVQQQDEASPLIQAVECLLENVPGILKEAEQTVEIQNPASSELPQSVKKFVNYPVLLQAAELLTVDWVQVLVQNSADVTVTYRLPDGRSTGITAMHAVLMVSDPTNYMKSCFNPEHARDYEPMAEHFAEQMDRLDDSGRVGVDLRAAMSRIMKAAGVKGRGSKKLRKKFKTEDAHPVFDQVIQRLLVHSQCIVNSLPDLGLLGRTARRVSLLLLASCFLLLLDPTCIRCTTVRHVDA